MVRVTEHDSEEFNALAWYLGVPLGQLVRRLLNDERRRLVDSGKRVPKKIPEE